jgi:hypothetical protein
MTPMLSSIACKVSAGSVVAVGLEREENAGDQKHDRRCGDQSIALTKSGRQCGEPGWKKGFAQDH